MVSMELSRFGGNISKEKTTLFSANSLAMLMGVTSLGWLWYPSYHKGRGAARENSVLSAIPDDAGGVKGQRSPCIRSHTSSSTGMPRSRFRRRVASVRSPG